MEGTKPPLPSVLNDQDLAKLRSDVQRWLNRRLGGRRLAAVRGETSLAPPVGNPITHGMGVKLPRRGRNSQIAAPVVRRQPTPPASVGAVRQKMWRNLAAGVTAGVVGVILISWGGIYLAGWDGTGVRLMARLLPLPAARAGSETLHLAEYLSEVERRRRLPDTPALSVVRDTVISDFARRVAERRHAAVQVPEGSLYDATERSRRRALEVRAAVASGQLTFAHAARQFSRHATAVAGGDLGYRRPSELTPELLSAVVGAPAGAVVGPISSAEGWWVVQVQEFVGERQSPELLVRLGVILIPSTENSDAIFARTFSPLRVKRMVPR